VFRSLYAPVSAGGTRHSAPWNLTEFTAGLLTQQGVLTPGQADSGAAAQWAMLRWAVRTPAWAVADREADRLVRRFRALVLAWNAGVLAVFGHQLLL